MGAGTADRAPVADLRIADANSRFAHHVVGGGRGAAGDGGMGGTGADPVLAVDLADAVEAGHAADVDEQARLRQPVFHERQEAVATGQDLGLTPVVGQQPQGVVQAHGPEVLELRRDHRRSSPSLPSARTKGADTALEADHEWTRSEARGPTPRARS
jgi:hypothetical protein